jgi:hypothetical protein
VSFGRRLSDFLALGGSFLSVAYGAYLLAIGPEASFMTPEGGVGTLRSPSLAGLIPAGIGLLAFWAAVKRRPIGLWSAAALAAASSLVFLFSFALQLVVLAAFLLVAAALSTVSTRDIRRRRARADRSHEGFAQAAPRPRGFVLVGALHWLRHRCLWSSGAQQRDAAVPAKQRVRVLRDERISPRPPGGLLGS